MLLFGRRARVVAQLCVFDHLVNDIDAEAVHATIQPVVDHGFHRLYHVRVAVVEVGLLGKKGMEIVLSGGRIERPRWSAERTDPVVWIASVRTGITPDVPVALRIRACAAR